MSLRTARAAAIALTVALGAVPAFAASPAAGDPVVATVNGTEIHRSDVQRLQQSLPQLRQVPLEMVYDQLLEHLINSRLIVAEARKANLQDDPQVKERLKDLEDQLVQQAYLQKNVESKLTDEALKKRYEQFLKENPQKEEVHARHILLPSEEAAKAVIAELQSGKKFEDVAKEKSTGPSGPNGGDLGYFTKDDMVPEFAEAAFALKPGEISKAPVKTQFGWHVIKVEDKRLAPQPAFDEVKDQLKGELAEEMVMSVVKDLRAKADVKIIEQGAAAPAPAAEKSGGKKQ